MALIGFVQYCPPFPEINPEFNPKTNPKLNPNPLGCIVMGWTKT